MIHIIQDIGTEKHQDLVRQMYRMRARVFGSRMGWDVRCINGEERDNLDDELPVYIVHTNAMNLVDGSCRLLPTTGPTLIEQCFSDTVPDIANLASPFIWECTRFCVDRSASGTRNDLLSEVTLEVIEAILDVSVKSGIETILANFDLTTVRICQQAGFKVRSLGVTQRFKRPVYLGAFSIEEALTAWNKLREVRSQSEGKSHVNRFHAKLGKAVNSARAF